MRYCFFERIPFTFCFSIIFHQSVVLVFSLFYPSMGTPSPRLKEIGPWSEQFSSSGKRYYYNRETEVSQWEKPTEWKQAEKDQVEQRVRSSTVGTREDKNASSYGKLRHRPSVSSTSVAAHSSSVSAKPADSSTGHAVRSSTSSPSVINSSTAPKRPRLDEPLSSFSSRNVPSSTNSSANKKALTSAAVATVPTVSSSTDHHQQRCASVSSSSPAGQCHQTPPISSFSSTSVPKRTSFSGTPRMEDENGISRQNHSMRSPSKSVSTPTATEEPKKSEFLVEKVENNTKCQMNCPKLLPVKGGSLFASEGFATANPVHRNGNTNSKLANGFDQSEKQQSIAPRDDTYTKFYHPEQGTVAERRLLNSEEFIVNLRRCVDRKAKHANIVFSIDRDLHSVQTLSKVAEFRSQLLKQRIAATSKRIQELESKSQ